MKKHLIQFSTFSELTDDPGSMEEEFWKGYFPSVWIDPDEIVSVRLDQKAWKSSQEHRAVIITKNGHGHSVEGEPEEILSILESYGVVLVRGSDHCGLVEQVQNQRMVEKGLDPGVKVEL